MTQDTFNKIVSSILFGVFIVWGFLAWWTNKPVNYQDYLPFLVPTINHVVHQLTQAQVQVKTIDAATTQAVASTQAAAVANGVQH